MLHLLPPLPFMCRRKHRHVQALQAARMVKPPSSGTPLGDTMGMGTSEEAQKWKEKGLESVASAFLHSRLKLGAEKGASAPLELAGDRSSASKRLEQYKAAVSSVAAALPGGDEDQLTLKYLLGKVGCLCCIMYRMVWIMSASRRPPVPGPLHLGCMNWTAHCGQRSLTAPFQSR